MGGIRTRDTGPYIYIKKYYLKNIIYNLYIFLKKIFTKEFLINFINFHKSIIILISINK